MPLEVPELGGTMLWKTLQALRLPNIAIRARMLSIARQLRRRAGIPSRTSNARTAPPPVPPSPLPFPRGTNSALDEVEVTVTVVVPVLEELLRFTVELPAEQVGRSVAPAGEEVSEQDRVTVPTYPVIVLTVIVEVAGEPLGTAAGVEADSANVGVTGTVMM